MVKKILVLVLELLYLKAAYPVLLDKVKETKDETDDKVLQMIHSFMLKVIEKLKEV